MIRHTFKSLKTIKSTTACFTVKIIGGGRNYITYILYVGYFFKYSNGL